VTPTNDDDIAIGFIALLCTFHLIAGGIGSVKNHAPFAQALYFIKIAEGGPT